jgi:uncharacterized protein with beta-barrel porin domain
MTYVCACPSGIAAAGAANRSGSRFRDAFLGTVAAGALSLAFGGPAMAVPLPAGCTVDITGTIETCTGNQSAGIAITSPTNVTTLNVNNLTQAIAPPIIGPPGTDGISFSSTGAVTINSNTGAFGISTTNADGIYASNVSGALTVTSTGNISTAGGNALGIDAMGGVGAGAVTVTSTGNITTGGTNAGGIFASGAGAVTVTSTGNITTQGATAYGIKATGADAVTVTSTGNITTGNAFGILASTTGAGAVTVTSTGNISTAGSNAYGILARSTGGGAVTVTSTGNITTGNAFGILASTTTGSGAVTAISTGNITTAGNGAFGIEAFGNAGAATVTSIGNITTAGNGAFGIEAVNAGAGAVTVTSTGNISTAGSNAYGIFAQSTGGGAVTVTSTGNITTGNVFGILAHSTAGAVTVTSTGNITTSGSQEDGIRASSGGTGAVAVTSTGNITTVGATAYGIFAQGGGSVTVTSTGNITTAGNNAFGIFAEGGGSGAATVTSTGNIATVNAGGILAEAAGSGAATVISTGNITTTGNGAFGIAASANAGAVTVTSIGNITTAGNSALGIQAISDAAGAVTVTSTGNITTAGSGAHGIEAAGLGGGAITVTSTGNISAAGSGAHGIEAGSFGGGAVTVTSAGNISAAGSNASGIFAESIGGPIAVIIKSGTVSGGSGSGAGVSISGGTGNTLTNMGTLMALSGLAIQSGTGNDTVNNSGTVIGNVSLGAGTNAFNNMAGGLFNSGAAVNLGATNTLTNAGTLSPGGTGVIQTTALTGSLAQSATGRLLTDINIAGATSDRVNVSGTANLSGAVRVQVQNAILGPWQQTVLSAAGGATQNGLSLLASPALQAQLLFPNATDVVVKSTGINFLTSGLNGNQTSLGNALNGAAQNGGLGGPVFNFLLNGVTSVPGYNLALNQLSGEAATGTQQTTFDAMNTFMGTMLDPFNRGSKSMPGTSVSGYASEGDASAYASDGRKRTPAERDAYAMFTKAPPQNFEARWNVWAAGFGGSQTTDGNAAAGSNSATSRIAGTAVGADYLFSPNTIAGFALAGGGTNYVVGNGLGSGHSDLFQAGVYARHTMGAAYIAGALAFGWQDITTDRAVTLAGLDQLQARFNANAFSGRVEGGYRFVAPWIGMGITPYGAAQFTTFDLPAYAEQALIGTNNFALAYGTKSVTDPRSEFGFRTDKSFAMPDGVLMLRGRLAWAYDYDTGRSIAATFQTLPGASFVVNGAAQASNSVLTTASIERKWTNNWSIAATFEGEFSNVTSSYAGKGVVRYAW